MTLLKPPPLTDFLGIAEPRYGRNRAVCVGASNGSSAPSVVAQDNNEATTLNEAISARRKQRNVAQKRYDRKRFV